MDVINPLPEYLQTRIKRYWQRRRYEKIQNASRIKKKPKKLKINRLGSKKQRTTSALIDKKKALQKLLLSPLKLMERLHTAYVDAMLILAGAQKKKNGRKWVGKGTLDPVLMMSAGHGCRNEMVDSRMVMEIYYRLVSLPLHDQYAPAMIMLM